eukprot:m.221750 g.221750  ORF g.221750 m.221750 type:complete len:66 (+) comp39965_c0_seq2:12-209(+)
MAEAVAPYSAPASLNRLQSLSENVKLVEEQIRKAKGFITSKPFRWLNFGRIQPSRCFQERQLKCR